MTRLSRRNVLTTAAAGGAALATPWFAHAQGALKSEYRLSVVGNRPIPISDTAFRWADLVKQRSGGRINIKVYPGSQLGGGGQSREPRARRQFGRAAIDGHPPSPGREHRQRPDGPDRPLANHRQAEQEPDAECSGEMESRQGIVAAGDARASAPLRLVRAARFRLAVGNR